LHQHIDQTGQRVAIGFGQIRSAFLAHIVNRYSGIASL